LDVDSDCIEIAQSLGRYTFAMARQQVVLAVVLGIITGLFSGLLGIGGGLIVIAGMVGWLHTRQHEAHGSSLVAVIPIAVVGVIVMWLHNHDLVRLTAAAVIGGASIVGAPLGARLAHATSALTLRRIVGVTALGSSAAMFGKVLGWI
jgi:uncharacterized membrane protein YfcA